VLSLRRVPGLVARLASDSRLRAELDRDLDDPGLGGGGARSCLVVRQGRRVIYRRRPDEALLPASNMKLLTGMAALARLGEATRLTTEARATQAPAGAVVQGDLWLVGGGDPLLATNDFASTFTKADLLPPSVEPRPHTHLEELADAIQRQGVREIHGRVMGDDSRYDAQRFIPTWKPAYAALGEVGPIGALVVNDGFAQFSPRVVLAPAPAVHAAAVLTALLQARGVSVSAPPGQGVAPRGSTVASIDSLPIGEMVATMLRESDNDAAEDLVKELGARFGGQGSTAAGLPVVRAALEAARLPVATAMVAVDGSGLDRADRATCSLLVEALAATPPDGHVRRGLPVAGRSGTLGRRFGGTPAAGRLRAKTGALEGVAALTGLVDQPGGDSLVFSLLANELPRESAGRGLEDRVGAGLASYPAVVPTPDLGPEGPQ
jgi:D-alanyl-D-alanine carboxypeptidase/D-alanyl-D-alanine-endopeptidase (penicillin-binding protein 4)